jgi:simple sugar transport system substrate-binding protein
MRKKILAALLCGMVAMTTGCASSDVMVLTPSGDAVIKDDDSGSSKTTQKATEKATEKATTKKADSSSSSSDLIRVGFAQVGSESDWRLAQTASMKQTFTEANGYQFDFVDCNNDQSTQLKALEQFISDGVDYIVLDPIIETGYDDVLKSAQDAGIPVIVVDRNIAADESLYTCWVGSDFTQEGKDAADWLKTYLESKNRASEAINIVTIMGTTGASAQIGRTEGFNANMASNWTMLDSQDGDFTEDGGRAIMNAFLKQYSDIDVVICQNDNEAYGAIDAIHDAGLTCGPNGDIIIISFDATNGGFQKMIDGEINVDVECNPLEGPLVSELIQKLAKGETVDKIQYVDEGVYPADTAADIIDDRAY